MQVANEVIGEMNLKPEEVFLAQGTLRPDLIESASHLASGKAEVIKTHHNDTELVRKLRNEVGPFLIQQSTTVKFFPVIHKNSTPKHFPVFLIVSVCVFISREKSLNHLKISIKMR